MHSFHGWEQGLCLNWVNPDYGAWWMLWSSGSSIKGYFPQFLPVLLKSLLKRWEQGLKKKTCQISAHKINVCIFFKTRKLCDSGERASSRGCENEILETVAYESSGFFVPAVNYVLTADCFVWNWTPASWNSRLLSRISNRLSVWQNGTLWEVYQVVRCTWSKGN